MFEGIVDFAQHNQFLTGGVGAMAIGWAAYTLRAIPGALSGALHGNVLVHVKVGSKSVGYCDVDAMLSRHRIRRLMKGFEYRDGSLTAGYGHGLARWNGVWIHFNKYRESHGFGRENWIDMTFYTADVGKAAEFLEEARPEYRTDDLVIHFETGSGWSSRRKRRRRLDSVFANGDAGAAIVDRIRWFDEHVEWFEKRGLPRKIGFVLHGPPGTGKTSLIQAIASETGHEIYYARSLFNLSGLVGDMTSGNAILVIEDIDTLADRLDRGGDDRGPAGKKGGASTRAKEEESASVVMHDILNTLDGMQTPDGLKFIITTNHLDRLDPAILRPGRVDHIFEIGPLEIDEARRMFRAFYDRDGIRGYVPTTGAALQHMFSTMAAEEVEAALDAVAADGVREAA